MKKAWWEQSAVARNAILALILVCIALIVHEIFGEHGWLALRSQRRQYDVLQQRIQQLQRENQQLEQQIKALRSDPKAIEKLAREQMKLVRPGETVYTLPEKEPPPPTGSPQNPAK